MGLSLWAQDRCTHDQAGHGRRQERHDERLSRIGEFRDDALVDDVERQGQPGVYGTFC
jgi:hypothetical protein